MSTLVAQTISNGTVSTSSANVIQGSAKAWVNFNGVSSITVRASYNVSSVTRNNTGDYTVNFTNALPDANYSVVGTGQRNNTNQVIVSIFGSTTYNSLTTTSARMASRDEAGNSVDSIALCISVFD
jgi:hypothetical protein